MKTRGEAALSTNYSEMSESAGKHRNSFVDDLKDGSKLSCLIHVPGHSSDECKILGDFGYKYFKIRPTKDHRQYPTTKKKFGRHQEKNDIV